MRYFLYTECLKSPPPLNDSLNDIPRAFLPFDYCLLIDAIYPTTDLSSFTGNLENKTV